MKNDEKEWYSTTVRVIAVVQGIGAVDYMDCVHIFRARDWDDAFSRALALGRTHEQQYVNAEGDALRWRLKEIRTLERILAEDLDGAEVRSGFTDVSPDEQASFDTEFHPDDSQPVQTL